ncbi:type II toxin-antitoxin system RelE/ParE family toxin [Flavobacterium quisquiliarum]|uniref:Type II toxin-antitoxin system RelE/ParE family toxin n=1 Tax=Flavobacterium quisquiliarum TaxID=1834436 RepID=A0ABV8W961_9FLAO|nr:type II toxin-antitoxin system RelE/ParE family toxin [Flavobacterium quisquiliarum]MBW1656382.1 type II toxin-antitoxin system RelE/ParE family toxin [Flavobacterium quisquiliarum]NWL03951.1 type II toxin-antitoxin system RelE/ParE family toxin [Flavobacterium collinsii]
MIFNVVIEPRAILDIQEAIDYYESKRIGLGEHFYEIVDEYLVILSKNPFFEIRYKDYRALPIRKFPFIIFYFIDEKIKTVYIMSVFNTSLSPSKYPL